MTFVPPPGPSPRAEELARRIQDVVEAYRREHPDLSRGEIRRALRIARRGGETRALALGMAAGVVLLLSGFAAYYRAAQSEGDGGFPVVPFVLLLVLLVGWVLYLRMR